MRGGREKWKVVSEAFNKVSKFNLIKAIVNTLPHYAVSMTQQCSNGPSVHEVHYLNAS